MHLRLTLEVVVDEGTGTATGDDTVVVVAVVDVAVVVDGVVSVAVVIAAVSVCD